MHLARATTVVWALMVDTGETLAEAATAAAMEAEAAAVTEAAVVMDEGTARFVAFSAIDGQPWEVGPSAALLLERVRSLSALGIGLTRCTEILDCGAEADEVLKEGVPLDEARRRFHTVFRGEDCGPGLGVVDFPVPENGGAPGVRLRKGADSGDVAR